MNKFYHYVLGAALMLLPFLLLLYKLAPIDSNTWLLFGYSLSINYWESFATFLWQLMLHFTTAFLLLIAVISLPKNINWKLPLLVSLIASVHTYYFFKILFDAFLNTKETPYLEDIYIIVSVLLSLTIASLGYYWRYKRGYTWQERFEHLNDKNKRLAMLVKKMNMNLIPEVVEAHFNVSMSAKLMKDSDQLEAWRKVILDDIDKGSNALFVTSSNIDNLLKELENE